MGKGNKKKIYKKNYTSADFLLGPKNEPTKKYLQHLFKKYTLSINDTKQSLVDRLCGLRGGYLSNTERKAIISMCSNNKNKKIMKKMLDENYRQKLPKN